MRRCEEVCMLSDKGQRRDCCAFILRYHSVLLFVHSRDVINDHFLQ